MLGVPGQHCCVRLHGALDSLKWCNLEERRKKHLLIMCKVINNTCLNYLQKRLPGTSEVYNNNLRSSNYDLQLPPLKTNFPKCSFSYQGAMA